MGGIIILINDKSCRPVLIVMPSFNEGIYISRTLNSLLNQSFSFFEIHIFDNASDDDTLEIIHSFIINDSRINLHKSDENVGLIENYHRCYEYVLNSEFEFFLLAQADDIFDVTFLESLYCSLEKNPLCSVSYGSLVTIDSNDKTIRKYPTFSRYALSNRLLRKAIYIVEPETLGKCNLFLGLVRINDFRSIYDYNIMTNNAFDYIISYRLVDLNHAAIVTDTIHFKRVKNVVVEDLNLNSFIWKDYFFGNAKKIDFLSYLSLNYLNSTKGIIDYFAVFLFVSLKWIISSSLLLFIVPLQFGRNLLKPLKKIP